MLVFSRYYRCKIESGSSLKPSLIHIIKQLQITIKSLIGVKVRYNQNVSCRWIHRSSGDPNIWFLFFSASRIIPQNFLIKFKPVWFIFISSRRFLFHPSVPVEHKNKNKHHLIVCRARVKRRMLSFDSPCRTSWHLNVNDRSSLAEMMKENFAVAQQVTSCFYSWSLSVNQYNVFLR